MNAVGSGTAGTAGLVPRWAELPEVRLRYVEAGEGPLVLLLHGFPQYLHCWRAQLPALADAGYHCVAVDLRGYGGSSAPADPSRYSQLHLTADLVELTLALGHDDAVLVGHDMGAHLAWAAAVLVPDRVRAVAALSVPLRARGTRPPLEAAAETLGAGFYQIGFQPADAPERDLDGHVDSFLAGIFDGLSGAPEHPVSSLVVPDGAAFSDLFPAPAALPHWLEQGDLDAYISTFRTTGFAGAVNWYRNIDRNWELMAAWAHETVRVPSLYLAGERDIAYVGALRSGALDALARVAPALVGTVVLPGCGHWTMEERPDEVNANIIDFLSQLDG